ncbi:MAG: hypothetical protein ABFR33_09675 [Verrucomicrobiota bacterium]
MDTNRHEYLDYSVKAIAHDCGFSSATYFTHCFTDAYGMPPLKAQGGRFQSGIGAGTERSPSFSVRLVPNPPRAQTGILPETH